MDPATPATLKPMNPRAFRITRGDASTIWCENFREVRTLYYTYGVAIQTNAIFPISSYLFKFLLVNIIAVIIVNRSKWKVIVKPSTNIAYVEVSQFLRCQPKYRAMIGLRFTGDSDIRGHIHGDVTRTDIAVLTHGVLSWEDVRQLRRTVTPSSGGQRSHPRYLWQKINTEWLSLQPDCDLLIKSFSFLVEDFTSKFFHFTDIFSLYISNVTLSKLWSAVWEL